jgi:hypothetical protein
MGWYGLMWLRIGTSGGILWTRYWTFGFHKMLGSSWVAAQFAASQEGLSSVSEWVVSTNHKLAQTQTHTYVCTCILDWRFRLTQKFWLRNTFRDGTIEQVWTSEMRLLQERLPLISSIISRRLKRKTKSGPLSVEVKYNNQYIRLQVL